ncbi:MAG: MFS transporter [Chloroflexi bacterium]|nr:MFS transporter [Chloroflexota bacterium]
MADRVAEPTQTTAAEQQKKSVTSDQSSLRNRLSVLNIVDFRYVILANVMMFSGFQIRNMSQAWLTLELTDSTLWVGIVNAMPGFSIIALSLLGGAVADRSERRKIQLRTRFVIGVMAFFTAFLVASGNIEAWHLIPIGLITGSMFAFQNPAGQAYVMDVVGKDRILPAMSLNSILSNLASIIGPAIGGALLAIGIDIAFFALAGIYSSGFVITIFMKTRSTPNPNDGKSVTGQIIEGVRYSVGHPLIRSLLLFAFGGVFAGMYMALYPQFARDVLDVGGVGFGVILAMQGLGALVGSTALILFGDIKYKGTVLIFAVVGMHLVTSVLGFTESFPITLVVMFFSGAAFGTWFVLVPTMLQTVAKAEMRGRVMSVFFMIMLIFQPGGILGGVIEKVWGIHEAFIVGAIGGVTVGLIVFAISPALRTKEI